MIKKLYKKIIKNKIRSIERFYCFKIFVMEWFKVLQKRPLYKHIKWSKNQKREFNLFWKNNYGKTISNRWHKLYESINGFHNIEYIPEILFSTRLEKRFNDMFYAKSLENKALNEFLFINSPSVRCPKTLVIKDNGIFYDSNRNIILREEAVSLLYNVGECVFKPSKNTSSGENVFVLNIYNGIDIKTNKKLSYFFDLCPNAFLIQEKVIQSENLNRLYSSSLNTLRIITYVFENKINHCPIVLKLGCNGKEVDNVNAGGLCIFVNDSGELSKTAFRLKGGDKEGPFYEHPDSKIKFEGYKLVAINEIIEVAYKLHGRLAGIGCVSWDIAINKENTPIVIEANMFGQSSWFPQITSGESLFRNDSKRIINTLRRR